MKSLASIYAWALLAVISSACLALTVSLQMGFFTLLFALLAWWAWENDELALLFFLALAPLLPMFKITQTIGTFTLAKDVIIIVLFLKVFLIPFITQKLPYRRNVFFLPLLFLLGWVAITLATADSSILGILRARDMGLYILFYLAVLYMPYDVATQKRRLVWFLSSAAVLVLAGVYQYFFAGDSAVLRFDPVRQIWIPRISSTFAHPTVFGEYLILLSSFMVGLVIASKRWRMWAMAGSLLLLPFIYLTYSRGVWLGYVAALGVMGLAWFWHSWITPERAGHMWKWLAGTIVTVGFVVILLVQFTPVGTFVRTALDPAYASNQIRLEFLARLLSSTGNTQALFGHGLGDIDQRVIKSVNVEAIDIASGDSRDVQLAKDSTLVDNQYLKTFIEMGLVGLLIYGWLYARALKYSWRLSHTVLGLAALGFFTSFIIQGLFVDIWDVFPTNAMFWIMAAFVSQTSLTAKG